MLKWKYGIYFLGLFFLLGIQEVGYGQQVLHGKVVDSVEAPVASANVFLPASREGVETDNEGAFSLKLPAFQDSIEVIISHVAYKRRTFWLTNQKAPKKLVIHLRHETLYLSEVSVNQNGVQESVEGFTKLQPRSFQNIPTPFQEFNKVLATLPGVSSQNELGSSYTVRGGNFDENLIYVNGFQVFRPYLMKAGQQEGLSFVNTDMVRSVQFSSGGWAPRFGDKLSSVLNVQYKEPKKREGSLSVGLLGGSAYLGTPWAKGKGTLSIGLRHKDSRYLLNTLPSKGQYFPTYTDMQGFWSYQFNDKWKLSGIMTYGQNRYQVFPESRETEFGSVNQKLRFYVDFQGSDKLDYNLWQAGLKLTHVHSKHYQSNWYISTYYDNEREYTELQGAYRLCDVDTRPGSSTYDKCLTQRGVGINYQHARNKLEALFYNVNTRQYWDINEHQQLEWGIGWRQEAIQDRLNSYNFTDSAGFVHLTQSIKQNKNLVGQHFTGYVQHTWHTAQHLTYVYGVRLHYFDWNKQWLVSPRFRVNFTPPHQEEWQYHLALGLYQQPPFYRETRDFTGNVNKKLKAQSSLHVLLGAEKHMDIWSRPFEFSAEAFYKKLWHVIPYDIDDVRLRYYATNDASAYAYGADVRLSGEFIPGEESWFSIGYLETKENVDFDQRDYIRRPSDQRIHASVFFQDHLPDDPTVRMHLNLTMGTGFPFGPPQNVEYRNAFNGKWYHRVDIGFSKSILSSRKDAFIKSLWLGAEILNLTGAHNVISYAWITDVLGRQYAIPNELSARFLNVKIITHF